MNGVSGGVIIAAMWKNRFECLYNAVHDTVNTNRVHQRLELATDGVTHKLVLSDIHDALDNHIKERLLALMG